MKFDRKKFYDNYRQQYGSLSPQQVTGLNRLLDGIERDPHILDDQTGLQYAAYMLATVKRETAHTFMPIHEYGGHNYFVQRYGGQTRKGRELGNDTPEEGFVYRGAGDVQLTGESNFEKAEVALRREYPELVADFERRTGKMFDLTVGDQENDAGDANNVLDPAVSYAILSFGMRTGMFTGRRLSQFFPNGKPDYFNMRTIVNGHDHAQEIANDAVKFERILRSSTETFDDLLDIPTKAAEPSEPANVPATPVPTNEKVTTDQPPINEEAPAQITIETQVIEKSNGEQSKTTAATTVISEPVTVKAVALGLWSKVIAGFAALTALGINAGTVIQAKLEEVTINQLLLITVSVVVLLFTMWYLKRRQEAADAKTHALIEAAASQSKNTIHLTK